MSDQPALFEEPKFPSPEEAFAAFARKRIPELEGNILAMLKAHAVEMRPCLACKAQLFFIPNKQGARIPYTRDLVSHFLDCPNPGQFSGERRR